MTSTPHASEHELAVFTAYAATGSVKIAAQQLGISEAALKSRLRRLYRRNQAASGVHMAFLLWGIQRVVSPREKTPKALAGDLTGRRS